MAKVLVTGGTGFVGSYVILELLRSDHTVRTTVRKLGRSEDLLATLRSAGVEASGRLEVVETDLGQDAGWPDAVRGCDYVLHIASPFPSGPVLDEETVIGPARDGTLRVLKAARDAKVKRVVLTSSFAAIGYGHPEPSRTFTETDWSDLNAPLPAYIKSKAVAERAAWDFVAKEGEGLELCVLCPTGIFGPALSQDLPSSVEIVRSMLRGQMGACPRLKFGVADVRDVAALHVRAMTEAKAAGQRFIVTGGGLHSLLDVARTLRTGLGAAAKRVPQRELPSWLVRALARFVPKLRGVVPDLDRERFPSNEKVMATFGWTFRPVEETLVETGRSLVSLGLV